MGRIGMAVLVCGALDLGYAMIATVLHGGTVPAMLRGVASGPLGENALAWGTGGALLGVAVHFAIMAAMVAVYAVLARRTELSRWSPWVAGTVYGLLLYVAMNLVVLPLRWPAIYPHLDAARVAIALFPHIALVGVPLAFLLRRRR